ncbi:hypothetical protein NEHOM01_1578 [Nematocida homosporus]|uniref:uncharacterized protein n=1 Tax=Nematocida homosporus TaxID=1912981 RepID=UPI00221F5EBA|nr:uncharacterized protein NEHOM01_1578 [Nematocida homosporus]KAI5186610.1 hypothetical protein NEHOM01_1578 [Nematocida homosporus]
MRLSKTLSVLLAVYTGHARSEVCHINVQSRLQGAPDAPKFTKYRLYQFWPRDSLSQVRNTPNCPIGATCLPNYIMPASSFDKQTPNISPIAPPTEQTQLKNIKFHPKVYVRTATAGSGCLGLEDLGPISFMSEQTRLYLAACKDCTDASYRTMAMVYSSFDNPKAKWILTNVNGKCAIKNVASNMFLSRCKNCTANLGPDLISISAKQIIDDSPNELWNVIQKEDNTYMFQSAATGEYLAVCETCLAHNTTISSPAALFSIESNEPAYVTWAVHTKKDTSTLPVPS